MRIMTLSLFIIVLLCICGCAQSQSCVDGINKLPMYGDVKKCPEQIESDKIFLSEASKNFKDKKDAAKYYISRAWDYFYQQKLDTAMMRFNQAWLLDSLNADIYWGYGNLLGMQKKFKESLPFFEKSIKLNPNNAKALLSASISYGNIFYETKDVSYLNTSIKLLKNAAVIEPSNAQIPAQLAASYTYFTQRDSALKYMKIAEKLDPKAINPEVKKILTNK
jgi:tetratricopeptide (TPR) repeat protein